MPYTLYVPQGRTIRLTPESLKKGINGILLDDFGVCEMVILIGDAGISVTHADISFRAEDIEREINWVGQNCQKILIYRKEQLQRVLNILSSKEAASSKETLPSKENLQANPEFISYIWSPKKLADKTDVWQRQPVDSTVADLLIHFEKNTASKIHPNISVLTKDQLPLLTLLRHPDERAFTVTHKIEETLFCVGNNALKKQALIFDGDHWLPVPAQELKPRHSNQATYAIIKKHLNTVIRDRKLVSISKSLGKARLELMHQVDSVNRSREHHEHMTFVFAKYYQEFQNDASLEALLAIDLQEAIDDFNDVKNDPERIHRNQPDIPLSFLLTSMSCEHDQEFIKSLVLLLKQKEIDYEKIDKLFSEYENSSHTTYCKNFLLAAYNQAKENYLERIQYKRLAQLYQKQRKLIQEKVDQVQAIWPSKNYEAALVILQEIMAMSWCYEKSSPELITQLGNMGTCLQYLNRHEEAKPFFEQAINLRKTYQVLLDGLPKFQQRLQDCCEQIKLKAAKESKAKMDIITQPLIHSSFAQSTLAANEKSGNNGNVDKGNAKEKEPEAASLEKKPDAKKARKSGRK